MIRPIIKVLTGALLVALAGCHKKDSPERMAITCYSGTAVIYHTNCGQLHEDISDYTIAECGSEGIVKVITKEAVCETDA